jgi:hypothetical protein
LPKLRDVTGQIEWVDGLIGQMTPEQRKLLAGIVNPLMPTVNQLFDKSANDSGRRRVVEADNRCSQGQVGDAGRLTFARPSTADAHVGG